ncbi:ATP-binding cassette sub-family a member 3 [Plakobranchus ocellatus]|uniref:ATP-binding cassette sub-family a member 3 n=1 Tax=Plakobranchus ocellatus TaxID=259542 RepID=A0AAV4C8L0_9GAST|nr:ATP-binding cassette sub-family a member 3 [Plakobranchus ocellatus]
MRPSIQHDPDYIGLGIVHLQALVGEALAKYWLLKDGRDPDTIRFGAYLQRMAYPPYFYDPMIEVLQSFLPHFLILSFILSIIINTKYLVYEKESKLKESMKLMGLQASVHWLSWFITFAIYLIPSLAIYALLLSLDTGYHGRVLPKTDPTVFFAFLLCYGIALITFSFMVSTFVQTANVGAALGGILFYSFYIPSNSLKPSVGKGKKLVAGLFFNTAMALGANFISFYEAIDQSSQEPEQSQGSNFLLRSLVLLGGGAEWRHSRSGLQCASGEDNIPNNTIVLTFDSPKLPSRIHAGYLTLDLEPYVLLHDGLL